MTCVAGHQPNLYPYGGFFAKMNIVDVFVIVDNSQYVKKQYHNRNRVKLVDGRAAWLSVPVVTSGRFGQAINEVEIDPRHHWRNIHLKSLLVNYQKAPFFDDFFPEVRDLLSENWERLVDFNLAFIQLVRKHLEIETQLEVASERKIDGKATDLIVDICRKTEADTYLHGRHARDYVDFNLLERESVNSLIQRYDPVDYPQLHGTFIPNLSVLDVIFNCGPRSKEVIMGGNNIEKPNQT